MGTTDDDITGAALTGSAAGDTDDLRSDVDLFLGVADGVNVADLVANWTSLIHDKLQAVHHFDLQGGSATYRAFLLDDGLEVDLGFTAADNFGPLGDGAFAVV